MSDETQAPEKPKRKVAPDVRVNVTITPSMSRKQILDELDREYPEFVHSYQSPELFGANAKKILWEMRAKGQEVVKDSQGEVICHLEDPVVRQSREDWDKARLEEARQSREAVETVVKPHQSTVKRRPREQIELPKKE